MANDRYNEFDELDGKPSKAEKRARRNRTVVKWLWLTFLGLAFFIVLLMILIYNGVIGYMPPIEELEDPHDKLASLVYASDGTTELGRYYYGSGNRVYTDYNGISEHVINALVATEDVRYKEHSGIDFKAGLHAGSLHSRVLLLEESVQSRSATVYASLGAISNTSAPIASAIRRATASVTPLAEKYATSVFPDIALSLTYRNSVRAKRAYALERARAQGPVLDFRHSWPIAIMDEEKAMFFFAYACLRVSSKPYDWTQL